MNASGREVRLFHQRFNVTRFLSPPVLLAPNDSGRAVRLLLARLSVERFASHPLVLAPNVSGSCVSPRHDQSDDAWSTLKFFSDPNESGSV